MRRLSPATTKSAPRQSKLRKKRNALDRTIPARRPGATAARNKLRRREAFATTRTNAAAPFKPNADGFREMGLKASRYNFFYPAEDAGGILFNSRTGAAIAAEEATARAIVSLLQEPDSAHPEGSNFSRIKETLVREEFLVPDHLDELDEIRKRRRARQNHIAGLSLTVAVTRACNFRCVYCYQDHPVEHMSFDTAEALLRFALQRLPPRTALYVTWFGGEPLLNVEIIEFLSRRLKAICDDKECSYDTFMVTNGYRLTLNMARRLAELGIGDYQISIDGDQDYHDRQRPLAGGQGTFDTLMKNLSEVAKEVSSITVRINLLHENIDSAARLISRLETLQAETPALSISLGRVDNSSDHCGSDQSSLLSNREFTECERALLGEKNQGEIEDSTPPTPFDTTCCADRSNAFVIAPSGDVFKCWNSLGRADDAIGRVDGEIAESSSPWLQFQADDDTECRECKFLPICQGGCSDVQIRTGRNEKNCTPLKYTLRERLEKWAFEHAHSDSQSEPSSFGDDALSPNEEDCVCTED
jgi:uncharacterized protein